MYDASVSLAEAHQDEICLIAVQLFKKNGVPQYMDRPAEELAKRVQPALQMHLRYLKSGNIEQWKVECVELATIRIGQGVAYISIIQASEYVIDALEEFFQTTLPAHGEIDKLSPDKVVAGLHRRLQGLKAITTTTIMSVAMKNKAKP